MIELKLLALKSGEIIWHTQESDEKYASNEQIIEELRSVLETSADEILLHIERRVKR